MFIAPLGFLLQSVLCSNIEYRDETGEHNTVALHQMVTSLIFLIMKQIHIVKKSQIALIYVE